MPYRFAVRTAVAAAMILAPATVFANDRAPTAQELAAIERSLQSSGFVDWDEIEFDDGLWEVDDARTADGAQFDLKLDPETFAIVAEDPD